MSKASSVVCLITIDLGRADLGPLLPVIVIIRQPIAEFVSLCSVCLRNLDSQDEDG